MTAAEPSPCRSCWHDRADHDETNHWICTATDTNDEPCLCNGYDPHGDAEEEH